MSPSISWLTSYCVPTFKCTDDTKIKKSIHPDTVLIFQFYSLCVFCHGCILRLKQRFHSCWENHWQMSLGPLADGFMSACVNSFKLSAVWFRDPKIIHIFSYKLNNDLEKKFTQKIWIRSIWGLQNEIMPLISHHKETTSQSCFQKPQTLYRAHRYDRTIVNNWESVGEDSGLHK